jgi:hypothetical protein
MNVKGTEVAYWDEHNKNMFPWYKKGRCKKLYRKRFYKRLFKALDNE